MTVKEFSEKYGIPYRIVFDASYSIPYNMVNDKEKHYNPDDLRNAVYRKAMCLLWKYQEKASLYGRIVMKMLADT